MNRFRNRHIQMLIATDVAARGLDVNDLTHVINYNLPHDLEVYIHRSGRTGRAGKSGTSVSIVHTREVGKIKDLEKLAKKSFKRKMIPGGKEICKKQLFSLVDKVEKVELNDRQIEEFLPDINKKLGWLSREDLIKHFVSVEFNRFLSYYKNAPDLNVDARNKPEKNRITRRSKDDFTRLFINIGKKNKINANRLIGLVNDHTRIRNIEIGKIDIMKNFSFFEIDSLYKSEVLKAFSKHIEFEGVKLSVEISKPFVGKNNPSEAINKGKGSYKKGRKKKAPNRR